MLLREKVIALREAKKMTQEQLAEQVGVSRQAVSKWEMGQSQPQAESILRLAGLFGVTTDELLKENVPVFELYENRGSDDSHYFGIDGFRGEVNAVVTAERVFRIGRYLGWRLSQEVASDGWSDERIRVAVGKDTRRSGYMLENALTAGLTVSGADVYRLHVTTTPSVSCITRNEGFDCGIMISASHDPFADNGIKLMNRFGEKMSGATISDIERYLDGNMKALGLSGDLPAVPGERIGCVFDHAAGRNRYVGRLISAAAHSYRGLRIGLDCANGAAWRIAPAVFRALGASVAVIHAAPDGVNINRDAGSTHIDDLAALVKERCLDMGFAFDGDADRCIAVDGEGNEIDGDCILYILARRMKRRGRLERDTAVATVVSGEELERALEKEKIRVVRAPLGDQNVYEAMQKGGYKLGGEKTGHVILRDHAVTGDGILTALMLVEETLDCSAALKELARPVKELR